MTYFLGLEIHTSGKGIFLNPQKHTNDLITLAHLSDAKPVTTTLKLTVKYSRDDGEPITNPSPYQTLVGSLNYLTMTRPDIAHVHIVSQFMHDPRHLNMSVVYRIIRYLHGSPNRNLFFPTGSPMKLVAYAYGDAD